MVFCDKALFIVRLVEATGAITHSVFDAEDEALFSADAEFRSGNFSAVSVFKGPHQEQREFLDKALEAGTIEFRRPLYHESFL